jgi:predicted phosphodiesterase
MAPYGLAIAYGGTRFIYIHGSSCLEKEELRFYQTLITAAGLQITVFIAMKTSSITYIFLIFSQNNGCIYIIGHTHGTEYLILSSSQQERRSKAAKDGS